MKIKGSNWPVMMVVYEAGYHRGMAQLLAVQLADFRIRTVGATSRHEVLLAISEHDLDFMVVAGCGEATIDEHTGHVIQTAGEPPRFDGLGLGKLAKKKLPRLPGIFASGYVLSEPVLADIDRHGLAFLAKPFAITQLLELVLLLLWYDERRISQPGHYFSRGCMKQRTGDLPGALRDLTKAIQLNPHDGEAFRHRNAVTRSLPNPFGLPL
jgi:DNA-binding NtrC family response regulator